jgi:hypothetical protein
MIRLRALLFLVAAIAPAYAAEEAAPAAKPYPLGTCIVSGEKLGEMGDPVVLVKDGQEFKFCCHSCVKDFNKDPKKFADKLAAAQAPAKPEEAQSKAK